MHDPMTLAFRIYLPFWRKRGNYRYFTELITIWNVDPETDHTDDSCGWAYVKQSIEQTEQIYRMSDDNFNYLFGVFGRKMNTLEAVWTIWRTIARVNHNRWFLPFKEVRYILDLSYNHVGCLFRPVKAINKTIFDHDFAQARTCKNHRIDIMDLDVRKIEYTDTEKKLIEKGKKESRELFYLINRCYLTFHRKWYQHPKWHIHHWKIFVPPLKTIKRWLFGGTKTWHLECDDGVRIDGGR